MYKYKAIIKKIYDGDTITVDIDLGFYSWIKNKSLRISGIDTPEIRGSEKIAGKIVRDYLRNRFKLGIEVFIKTSKPDKYGRVLSKVYLDDTFTENIGDILLELGLAKPYNGGAKNKWTEEELNKIIYDYK